MKKKSSTRLTTHTLRANDIIDIVLKVCYTDMNKLGEVCAL